MRRKGDSGLILLLTPILWGATFPAVKIALRRLPVLTLTAWSRGLGFLTILALFLFGGPVLHAFSFALVCGILVGTYSSVFVASPIVLFWHNYTDKGKKRVAPVAAAPPRAESVKSPSRAR